ncbi:MAG: transcription antitermination factor NusB [Puniceicoccaceae bacterium]|nr:MAG: transcription antitermination factor NusB [Puniceicoccaceae bacterium]
MSATSQRRENRVAALQYLYAWSINPPDHLPRALELFFEEREHPRDYYEFAEQLIHGVIGASAEIDATIRGLAENWDFQRIARIDLAILRLAIFEMLHRKDIPPVVSINEAIDLSKSFSSADSKRFINGILDRLKDRLTRPLREPDWS